MKHGSSDLRGTGSLSDLIELVHELESLQRWEEVCKFGQRLFDETGSLQDAECLARALHNAHRSEALAEFLDENPYLVAQSNELRMLHAWGLYNEGALLESRAALAQASDDVESPHYRALRVNLAIALGDLGSLAAIVAETFHDRANRSAYELMGAAQLGLLVESPHTKALMSAAAEKAGDDPEILAGAYFLALSAGWEGDQRIVHWLHKAAELSDEKGPLQRMSLRDVLDRQPEWDRQEVETWQMMARGTVPIFLAAKSLNRSLVDLTVFPTLANATESDPRRRRSIPAYSGARRRVRHGERWSTIGLDATALLTLSFMKLLDKVLDNFETVYVPHSTLAWLLQERQRARFHQPSRIRNAHEIRDLLATGAIEAFAPTTVPSSELAAQVGEDLAALIAEAAKVSEDDQTQRIVVCPAPVYRLSTLMEEEADLSSHATLLSSCISVVVKLRQRGQITAEEEKRARAYLQFHERPWPNEMQISDGATLFLDARTVVYLLQLGMLGKLKNAGLRAVASPREISEANALISYERISEQAIATIERIRAALNARIDSGQVRVDRRRNYDEDTQEKIPEHPTVALFALASHCDAIIVDDRLINRHSRVEYEGRETAISTTLDLLDILESSGVISEGERFEYRTLLRRAGYLFMPVGEDELLQYLNDSPVQEGKIIETAELRAIRESVLRVRMSDWLQIEDDGPWLDAVVTGFVRVLKDLWKDGGDINKLRVCSDWIAGQIDARGWAHRMGAENGDEFVRTGRGAHILLYLSAPTDAQQENMNAYWEWVEERILAPVKEQFPGLYLWLVEWHKRQVSQIGYAELAEEEPL